MHILAPAKLNLYLHITGKRQDNYHLLDSLFAFTDFGDDLIFTPASEFKLSITGKFGQELSSSKDNIITRAVNILSKQLNKKPEFHIELIKNIPVGAGLGGGSADAAACLNHLSKIWQIDDKELIKNIALELGADVPSCLNSNPVFVNGIGEIIEPARPIPNCSILLVNPGSHISTPDVFRKFRCRFSELLQRDTITSSSINELCCLLKDQTQNDLTSAAISIDPSIKDVLSILEEQQSCILSRMSGSGATCFGIFETMEQAEQARKNILSANPYWWVQTTGLYSS